MTTTSTTAAPYPAGMTLPDSWPRVVGQGSWYGMPSEKLTNGQCNGAYSFTAYNQLYGCVSGGRKSWLGPDFGDMDALWFTLDLGSVQTVQSITIFPNGFHGEAYTSNEYELLISADVPGPRGPYTSTPYPPFSETSQGFTQVVQSSCGQKCSQEYVHQVNRAARYIMFHAIQTGAHSAGVEYLHVNTE
mmetsp:Transcript_133792/g.346401  ORF Transcript_133792/g.346401 Transcript_133792/m.346401 type:complete len:189 (+) Transcript_133792:2221-2787(+)